MKHTISILILLSSACCFAVTIPRASMRQISVSPLARGEAAYVESESVYVGSEGKFLPMMRMGKQPINSKVGSVGTAYAQMYVGGASGPLRVIDSSALRGYKLRTLDPSEYAISAGPLFAYDPVAGTYTMASAGPTNSVIITAKEGIAIEEVKITTEFTGEGLIPGEFVCSEETYDGSVFRWDCAFVRAASLIVKRFEVKAMAKDEVKWVNDTVETIFMIHDVLGDYNLSDLRRWARDLYNGNRGEDWSKYKAVKAVRMNGQAVRFTDDNRFTMSLSASSNLVMQAAMHDAMEVNIRESADLDYTTFMVTGIDCGSGVPGHPVELDFTCDIAGFSAANLGVMVCDGLEDNVWLGLPSSDYTVSNVSTSGDFTSGTVTIASGIKNDKRFFRLRYGAATTDVVDIVLHGRVIVKDVLILKGTDSKYYKINVNGGTISATEVSL